MIAFDTNILIRLVVEDDLVQWQLADQLLTRCVEDDQRCMISIPVLCEAIWVLRALRGAEGFTWLDSRDQLPER